MKILKLILSNFKHFKDQTIEFNDDINVLIGENNAGKTSIIQAIAAVFEIPFGGNIENEFPTKLIDPPFTTRVEIEVAFTKDELNILRGIKNIDVVQSRRFNDQEWDKIISFIIENNLTFRLRLNIEVPNKTTTQLRRGGLKREDLEIYSRVDEIREVIKGFNEDLVEQLKAEGYTKGLVAGYCAINEVGEQVKKAFGRRKVFFSGDCNNLADTARAELKLARMNVLDLVPVSSEAFMALMDAAKKYGSTALIPL